MPFVTPEDYLRAERLAPTKSEYYSGQVWAMSGASREHNAIAFNLGGLMFNALRGTPCQGFGSDMRVAVAPLLYTYPDLSVVCGEQQFTDTHGDTLVNPSVLFEILSPSTANYDRTVKFGQYRRVPSLREYVLVHQDAPHVERFERYDDIWATYECRRLSDTLELSSLGIMLPLSALYEGILFPPSEL